MFRILLTMKMAVLSASAFTISPNPRSVRPHLSKLQMSSATTKATLTDETTWKLRVLLNGVPTTAGKKVDQIFAVDAQFIEEEGYEPPQGFIRQVLPPPPPNDDDDSKETSVGTLKITKSRWILSEDPDDRKDGLWVWGLFKEPLYPFMLLQLETEEIQLPGGSGKEQKKDTIKPLKLYAQISHSRDKETGEVELKSATLNVRELETIKADPFGAATVDVYEEQGIGQISFQPQ